jgi:hypothetical protein
MTTPRSFHWLAPVLLVSAAAGLLPGPAQAENVTGSGRSATESRSVGEFQAIALRGSIDLEVRQGATPSLQVQADDNLLPYLETVLEAGSGGPVLQVRWKSGHSLATRGPAKVSVITPRLGAIATAGSGDVRIESFTTPALKLALSGSGDAVLAGVQVDDLAISVSGSADVKGSGQAGKLGIAISGSGDVKLGELRADDVSVRIAGSGDAEVHAQKTLTVGIAGSGDVVYRGDPAVKSSVAGSGSVRKR